MNREILEARNLYKNYGGINALADFSFSIQQGIILGLIGPNGAGKTTLFNVLSGFIIPEHGKVLFKGVDILGIPPYKIANIGIRRTFQNLRLIRQLSVLDNILLTFTDQPGEQLSNLFFHRRLIKRIENKNRDKAMRFLEDTCLVDKANDPAEYLSYGQQKLLSLICCLAAEAEIILLDEPVAGIAPEMIDTILGIIQDIPSKGKSIILIEHNLEAITRVCDRVIFIDTGIKVCEGIPEEVRNDPKVIQAYID